MAGYSPILPLQNPAEKDTYQYITDVRNLVKQNVKTILMTSPGERIWDPDFGVGVRNYLFEYATSDIKRELTGKIKEQFKKYMSFLNLHAVVDSSEPTSPDVLKVEIKYFIKPLSVFEVISLKANLLEKSMAYSQTSDRLRAESNKKAFRTK